VKTTRVYRYEDVIFRKEAWLQDMLEFLGIEHKPRWVKQLANRHDLRPEQENPTRHVRQVTPGNFREHFNAETLELLNHQFSDHLLLYDYNNPSAFGRELVFAEEGEQAQQLFKRASELASGPA
jgi:hypothetical protein